MTDGSRSRPHRSRERQPEGATGTPRTPAITSGTDGGRLDDGRLSRRSVLRGSAGAVAVPSTLLPLSVDSAITKNAAIPDSAPTFDGDDYTGLFVEVNGSGRPADASGVGDCQFEGSDRELLAYDVRIQDEVKDDLRSQQTTLYAAQSNKDISKGGRFVINQQQRCPGNYVSIALEAVGGSSAGTPSNPSSGETVTPGGGGTPTPTGTTDGKGPGFGLAAAVAGVLGAGLAALRGRDGS